MRIKSNYPVVLVHGMFGYGQQQLTNSFLPYFGLYNTDIRKMFNEQGIHCVAPSLGPFTSAWDRACELYAQLVGGRVDYGKAHSEKYGHKRYGRTYKALLPEWGQKDKNGDIIKVIFIGHSFGGVSARTLTELLINGSQEERNATDPNDLSPLFKGGNNNLVHSITTLASPHNGMTSVENSIGNVMGQICRYMSDVVNILDATPLRRFYDLQLDQFGITPTGFLKIMKAFKDKKIYDFFFNNKDSIVYDLTREGAAIANERAVTHDNIYYFSFRGDRTFNILGYHIPKPKAFPVLNILGFFMGTMKKEAPDKSWLANDMVINTVSAIAPDNAPKKKVKANEKTYKPGIWNVFPVEEKDHMSYCGWMEDKETYAQFYQSIYDRAAALPTINK